MYYNPTDIVHFDVIVQLIELLRQLRFPVRLVKIKNRTGCPLNEVGDEQADAGHSVDTPEVYPAQQKICILDPPSLRNSSRIRETVRE